MPLLGHENVRHATLLFCAEGVIVQTETGAGERRTTMSMNPSDLKVVVGYVENHPGCSEADIQAACPNVTSLHSLLQEASEGARLNDGYILKQENGLYYPGPSVHLGH